MGSVDVMSDICGEPRKSDGKPCQYSPGEKCPHHGDNATGNPGAGRPTMYSIDLAGKICRRIANGDSLRSICREDDMPSRAAVLNWLQDRPEFVARYEHARQLQAEGFGEEVVELSDQLPPGASHEDISRQKLRIDSRKWVAARMLPQKYGKTTKMEHTGKDGGPIEVDVDDARERIANKLDDIMERRAAVSVGNGDGGD